MILIKEMIVLISSFSPFFLRSRHSSWIISSKNQTWCPRRSRSCNKREVKNHKQSIFCSKFQELSSQDELLPIVRKYPTKVPFFMELVTGVIFTIQRTKNMPYLIGSMMPQFWAIKQYLYPILPLKILTKDVKQSKQEVEPKVFLG